VKTKFPICSKQVEKKINKMTDTSPYLSLITLNVNVPNSPIKTEVLRKKKKTQQCAAYKKVTSIVSRLKTESIENDIPSK
jgi:dihydroorotate dehydrogenase